MTITPFGRVQVQVQDLPTAKLQTRETSRRSTRERFPDPVPRAAPAEAGPVAVAEGPQADLEAASQTNEGQTQVQPNTPKRTGPVQKDEGTDGSEGALAFQPQEEVVLTGSLSGRDSAPNSGKRRQLAPDPMRDFTSAGISSMPLASGIAVQAQATAPALTPSVAGIEAAGGGKPINATQALLQRSQAQKGNKTTAAEPARRQSPIQITNDDRHSILESVSFALSEGKGEAMLLLNPKELGSLSIQLSMQGNQLSLRLSAERPEVAEALLEDVQKLKEMLQEQGLNVQDFDVRTGNAGDHRQEALDFRRNRGISSAGHASNGTADAETDRGPVRPKIVHIDGTGIDFIA